MAINPLIVCSSIAREIKYKFSIDLKHYGLVHYPAINLVTQSYHELCDFLVKYNIKAHIAEFDPSGKWAFINITKFKFKWNQIPKQYQINGKIYSLIEANVFVNPVNNDKLYMINTNNPDHIIYFYNGPNKNHRGSLHYIKKTFVGSSLIKENILVIHQTFAITDPINFPDSKLKLTDDIDSALEQIYGISHAVISIDRHGIYVNRPSRNKIILSDTPELGQTVIDEKYNIWVESVIANDFLFKFSN